MLGPIRAATDNGGSINHDVTERPRSRYDNGIELPAGGQFRDAYTTGR